MRVCSDEVARLLLLLLLYLAVVTMPAPATKATNAKSMAIKPSKETSLVDTSTSSKEPLIFNVTVLTWNLAEASPTEEDCEFIKSFRDSDLVVMGVQECEDIKPRRHEGRRSRAWRALQLSSLGSTYDVIAQHKAGGMQIAVYAKKKLTSKITGVLVLDVACGIGNVLSNKGAICVLLRLRKKTLAFVSAHLAAHEDKVTERNADYARITQSIIARAPISWLKKDSPVLASRKLIAAAAKKAMKRQRGRKDSSGFSFENVLAAAGIPADTSSIGCDTT